MSNTVRAIRDHKPEKKQSQSKVNVIFKFPDPPNPSRGFRFVLIDAAVPQLFTKNNISSLHHKFILFRDSPVTFTRLFSFHLKYLLKFLF